MPNEKPRKLGRPYDTPETAIKWLGEYATEKQRKATNPKQKKKKQPASLAEVNPGFGLPQPGYTLPRPQLPGSSTGLRPPVIPKSPPGQGQIARVPEGTKSKALDTVAAKVGGAVAAANAAYKAGVALNEATDGKAGEVAMKIAKATGKGLSNIVKRSNPSTTPPNAVGTTSTQSTSSTSSSPPSTTSSSMRGQLFTNGGKSYLMACDKPLNKRLDISTGIRSGLIVNEAEPMSKLDYSPLYLMGGAILKKDTFDTDAQNYIKQIIYPLINVNLQSRINYDYTLTEAQLDSWFETITKALQFYYFLESIIVYCSDKNNTNAGIRYMRTQITAPMLLKHNLIRDLLGKCAIPPRIIELVRYMCQNFVFGEVPGAPIYKIMMGNLFNAYAEPGSDAFVNKLSDGGTGYNSMFDEIINSFSIYSGVLNKVAVACPEWKIKSACLPPMTLYPTLDKGFETFWFNATLTYDIGTTSDTKYTRSSSSTTDGFRYWMSTNTLDGLWFAMSAFRLTTDAGTGNKQGCRPGLFDPTVNFTGITNQRGKCNMLYYEQAYDSSTGLTFRAIHPITRAGGMAFAGLALQAGNYCVPTWDYTLTTPTFTLYYNNDGSFQVAQECTFNTWKECVYNVVKWIFD